MDLIEPISTAAMNLIALVMMDARLALRARSSRAASEQVRVSRTNSDPPGQPTAQTPVMIVASRMSCSRSRMRAARVTRASQMEMPPTWHAET